MTSAALLDLLASLGRDLGRLLGAPRRAEVDSPEVQARLEEAEAAHRSGRHEEAITLYRRVLGGRGTHPVALRGLREAAAARLTPAAREVRALMDDLAPYIQKFFAAWELPAAHACYAVNSLI